MDIKTAIKIIKESKEIKKDIKIKTIKYLNKINNNK